MAKEKKSDKEVSKHLTEYANGRISIGRMLKWPTSPCNRWAKKGVHDGGVNFHFI
jgi:hypothetical protein